MPLVRVQVRNEYGLGQPELYRESNREDPRAVLDGVAVAGLVGILRQLGDLAEFAAEVFHGIQEQVMNTSSRSHKLMVRVQRIEAALPQLEKAILAQKSHLHFAYTAGSIWHAHLQNEQNHFVYSDLPQFIMDSYEECRDPPRLHLLDKFDTSGPGSCLKRYSDPNFFRRASVSSGEANVEKVSKERKAQRNKKQRSQRNEVSRGASMSNHRDRTQFAFPKVDGQISPSETDSTFDLTFDSRTGPGYIERVYPPTYSMKQEEHEPKQSSFSTLTMNHNNIVDSASVDEHSGVVDDDLPHSSLQEQTFPSSSCVTWDEKSEIVEPMDNQYDRDESVENLVTKFDGDTPENGAVNSRSVDQMDFQFDRVDATPSISGENHLDDIESETDNYMDALNTIESETETDLDCQTKREVEQSSNANNEGTQYEMRGPTAHHLDLQPSNLETDNAVHNSSDVVTSCDIPNSISSCYANEESLKMGGESSDIGNSLGMDFCRSNDILDVSNLESVVVNLPYSGPTEPNSKAPIIAESHPKAPLTDDIISTSCESEKSPIEPTGVQSVKFWTNGGLLGLEPSKPPDFSVSNAASQDSGTISKDDIVSPSNQTNILNGDGDAGNQNKLVQSSKSIGQISSKLSTSGQNDEEGIPDKKTPWRFLPPEVDAGHKKCGDSDPNNRFNDYCLHSLTETSASVPETGQLVTPDVKAVSIEASQEDVENASQVSGLSDRFLVNGFQRKLSLVHDENLEVPGTRKTDGIEQKSRNQSVSNQAFSERNFKGCYGSESLTYSPSSSPPLQHMKISFQPISGFETSKLKLKFPDGSFHHDSSREMLPSFQLVPEPATSQLDIGLDSDDDTFCRSSLYKSDDCLSPHSDTNSEQWESDDTPPTRDNELYDAFRRIGSTESVSSSMELEKMGHGNFHVDCGLQSQYLETCLDPFQCGQLLKLPSLSTLNPLFEQELKNVSDANGMSESHLLKEPTPLPPPLPPLEWRAMRSHSDESPLMISEQDSVCKALIHAFDLKILESTISTQSNPSPVKLQQVTDEAVAFTPKNKPDWQKINELEEDNQATNGRDIDEKEDFLHQIRTKSFNLRRTVTGKPTVTSGPNTNVKVTAILEKANAIRQAVGSDEGEGDDSWSDT